MRELARFDLEDLYAIFVQNGIRKPFMWSLTKRRLDEMHVPYPLLKKYFHKRPDSGRFSYIDIVLREIIFELFHTFIPTLFTL